MCRQCATSLAATFDPVLIEEAGAFLAKETKMKAATTLLAPTCNIQRNPLGGRYVTNLAGRRIVSLSSLLQGLRILFGGPVTVW